MLYGSTMNNTASILTIHKINLKQKKDFEIIALIKKISGEQGIPYGIVWGGKSFDAYYFCIAGNGNYVIYKKEFDECIYFTREVGTYCKHIKQAILRTIFPEFLIVTGLSRPSSNGWSLKRACTAEWTNIGNGAPSYLPIRRPSRCRC